MVPGNPFPPLGPERFGMVPTYDRIGGWPNLQAVTECRQCGTLDGRGRQLRDGRRRQESANLDELLQAAQARRVGLGLVAIAPVCERYLADVDTAARVDGQPLGRGEQGRPRPRP